LAPRAKPRRPRQQSFAEGDGSGRRVQAIEDAAEDYVEKRDARMKLTGEERDRHDTLLRLMSEHGLTEYEYDGKVIRCIDGERKVKVKKTKEAEENGEE
jgi:hypothetical protein